MHAFERLNKRVYSWGHLKAEAAASEKRVEG